MRDIAIVDIETSGFLAQGGLIVEIGIVGLNLDTGVVTSEFDSIVKESGFGPKHSRNPYGWVFKNSDLKYEDVLGAGNLEDMLPEIQNIFNKYPLGVAAYNKRFDFGFLGDRGLTFKEAPCIMLSATPIVGIPNKNGRKGVKWPKVEESWEYFFPDKEYAEKHRALDDAKHEALITYELYKRGKFTV